MSQPLTQARSDAAPLAEALEQDARHLAAVQQHVVGPFQGQFGAVAQHFGTGIEQGQRRHERPQGDPLGRFVQPQNQRAGQIACGHVPRPTAPPARRGLLAGQYPLRTGKARRDAPGLVQG